MPTGYKHKYCEACLNRQAEMLHNGLKVAMGIAGAAACVMLTVVTKGKVNPKN